MKPRVLIIDDDVRFIQDLAFVLSTEFECLSANQGEEGLTLLREAAPAAVLLDLMIGTNESGLDVLKRIQEEEEELPVIMITGHESVDTAVEAMKRGAYSYISKNTHTDELIVLLHKAIRSNQVRKHARALAEEVSSGYGRIVGSSPAVNALLQKIDLFAKTGQTVLITGDSGTGKELVARQIHLRSDRADRPFVAVNCAAIPRELLESELFGHEAGSFTGAHKRKTGKIEAAGNGIIFFDEIGELDPAAQSKLLRVLEQREFERVGGVTSIPTGARVLAATNRDLQQAMANGEFREDLYYRLEALTIHVPPLRERRADFAQLIDHFLTLAAHEMKGEIKEMNEAAREACSRYDWPGNIRELRNVITSAAILATEGAIGVEHLPARITGSGASTPQVAAVPQTVSPPTADIPIPTTWEEMDLMRREAAEQAGREVERRFLEMLLERHNGNVASAAREIGINRSNLYRMMKRAGLA